MSEQYIVSARKYRPANFRSVVGQKALTSTLKNAIESGRLAQAYLFTGPRGVGKTSCARIFAKTINCLNPTEDGEACGLCASCVDFQQGTSYNVIELDAASNNSVDDIRGITEQVNVPPQVGKYRVFIIDEVHMLSSQAFNAFLKTLEEPPKYVVFILATTEKHKVIPTILSRCQIYDFKRITIPDMVEHLQYVASQEGIEADPAALNVIARKADGAMRDALSIFDQVSAYSRGKITYETAIENLNVLDYDYYFRLVEAFRAGDVATSLLIYKEVRDKGFDSLFFVNGLSSHVRDLMMAADPRTLPLLEVAQEVQQKYGDQARSLPLQWYYAAMKILNDCDYTYRTASNKQLLVELALIRLCQLLKPAEPPFDRVDAEIPLRNVTPPATHASMTGAAPAAASRPENGLQTHQPQPQPQSQAQAQFQSQITPQPQPHPQSQTPGQVQPQTKQQPQTTHSGRGRRPGTRLSEMKAAAEAATVERKTSRNPVGEEAFMQAWGEFQAAHPDRQILVSAMRTSKVRQTASETFEVTVDHPASRQAFDSVGTYLIDFLRSRVGNDFISLEVVLNEETVVKKLPAAELLKEIVGKNPAIGALLAPLDAEIE